MAIKKIANLPTQELRFKEWAGWRIGWLTGWYNPFDRLGEAINPRELGEVVRMQGEFMKAHGELVQDLGNRLSDFTKRAGIQT